MRKLLLLMVLVLFSGGAIAQVRQVRLTADQLNAVTEKTAILIKCTQETSYNTYYNPSNGRGALAANSVVYWVPAGDGAFYITKGDGENDYLQTASITTFGTQATAAKFHAVKPTGSGDTDVTRFAGTNCYENEATGGAYWIRLAFTDNSGWFNFNGSTYNTGTGVWTVLNVYETPAAEFAANVLGNYLTDIYAKYYDNGWRFNPGVNNYSQPAEDQPLNEVYEEVKTFYEAIDETTTASQINEKIADLEYLLSRITINQPAAGFYRIKSMNGKDNNKKGKYLYVSNATYGLSQTEALNSIMYIDENHNIVNYTSGLHVNHYSAPATVGTEAVAWTFMENAKVSGAYTLKYNTGDQQSYFLSDWTGGVTYGQNDANAAWNFEEVTTLPVAFGEAKAATLYAPVALTIPAGVTAYAGSVRGEYVVLNEVSTTIPANTGVILMAEEAKSYDFAVTTTENTVEGNVLTGTVATINTPADANIYTLQAPENVLKMKLYNGTTLAGFKAYLNMTASPVQAFKLDLGEATGIESILNNANGKMVIYDMNGRRVQQMGKGLYIVNGKKVLVK